MLRTPGSMFCCCTPRRGTSASIWIDYVGDAGQARHRSRALASISPRTGQAGVVSTKRNGHAALIGDGDIADHIQRDNIALEVGIDDPAQDVQDLSG